MFDMFDIFSRFLVKYDIPEVQEVSRKLPGARGFAVIEYGPMASHGDPIPQITPSVIPAIIGVHPPYP